MAVGSLPTAQVTAFGLRVPEMIVSPETIKYHTIHYGPSSVRCLLATQVDTFDLQQGGDLRQGGGGGGKREPQDSGDSAAKPALAASVEDSSSLDAAIPAGGALQGGSFQGGRPPPQDAAPKSGLAESVGDSDSDSDSGTTLSSEPSEGGTPEQAAARAKVLSSHAIILMSVVL